VRPDTEMVAKTLKVLVEVKDVDARMLCCGSNRQVGERKAMGAVRATGCQLAHGRQNRSLYAAIHRNLLQALQRALGGGNPVRPSRIDH